MRKVLITAGAGLIGSALSRRLSLAGMDVVVLDERSNDLHTPQVPRSTITRFHGRTYHSETVERALDGCTDVVHLEWSGSVHDASVDPVRRHELAVDPAIRLLDQARKRGLRFVFASTCPYRGDRLEPSDEAAPLSDRSIYAQQKRYVETMVTAFARQFGLPACSLRIFNAYGEGGRPKLILNQLKAAIVNRTPIILNGDGEQVRDFVHVDDVAEAFYAALMAPQLNGEVVNVGTGVGTSMNGLIRLVEKISDTPIELIHAPAKGEESRYLVADIQKAAVEFGWWPKVSLEDGLRRTF